MDGGYNLFFMMLLMLGACIAVFLSASKHDESERAESTRDSAHDLAFGIGEAVVELSPTLAYRKLKDELHPKAADYYERMQGHNIAVVDIPERPKLRVVR